MTPLNKTFYRLCFAGLLSLTNCQRDIPIPPSEENNTRNITFRLSGFESEIIPLPDGIAKTTMGLGGSGVQALHNIVPSPEPQFVYYWSFNDETLQPDLAVDERGAGITFEAATANPDFVNGFALDPFEAGRALSIKGAKSLVIHLPMGSVQSLTDLSFDIKSSNTGPKDFSISYSIDGGITYEVLSATNQFENTGSTQRNPYRFDIADFPAFEGVEMLQFRLDFLEGDRGMGGVYNEITGAVHLDNVRISGVYDAEAPEEEDQSMPSMLRCYVFSSDDGHVVLQKELAMKDLAEGDLLKISLSPGIYDVMFLAYRSDEFPLLPENLGNSNEFYFGQNFDDYRAVTYALLKPDFEVGNADLAEPAILTRCFSLVTFDFTDLWSDLAEVKKIDVARQHANYLYLPYGEPVELPIADLKTITFDRLTTEDDYQLMFHQFLGITGDLRNVSYEITAYGLDGAKLNTVIISEDIRNNMQLRFRGRLLGNLDHFAFEINPDWEETIEHEF